MMLVAFASGMEVMAQEAYAVLNDGTLTFYYDNIMVSRIGTKYTWDEAYDNKSTPDWARDHAEEIVRAVFDESFSNAKPKKVDNMFYNCKNLSTVIGIERLNTDNVYSFRGMFWDCENLQSSLDLSNWNTSHVYTMDAMFFGCTLLKNINVSGWDTGNVTNMSRLFDGCHSLNKIDVSGWDTRKVTDMSSLFYDCESLKTIDVSRWNTFNVTDMQNVFNGCIYLTYLDLSSWNTSGVLDMRRMFYNCSNLERIYCGPEWLVNSITEGDEMFENCYSLVGGAGTTYDSDHIDAAYAHIDRGTTNPGYLTSNLFDINSYNFPDANFRKDLLHQPFGTDGSISLEEFKNTTELQLAYTGEIKDLTGIEHFTELKSLKFWGNKVKKANLSENKKLERIECYANELSGKNMDDFIASLPLKANGIIWVYDNTSTSRQDQNEMTPEQVSAANAMGWTVKIWDETNGGKMSDTKGFWQINEERFPDPKFRNGLKNHGFRCFGILTAEDLDGLEELELSAMGIEDLTGIEYFSTVENIYLAANKLKAVDLSKNTAVNNILCVQNQISGEDMDFFVEHLPETTNGDLAVYWGNDTKYPEANEMTPEQVAIANSKGWRVNVWNEETNGWAETQGFWRITEERFPDANFRKYVSESVERCTGALTYEEASARDELTPGAEGIADLTGIEYFIGLEILDCAANKLTALDLSKNVNLTTVNCANNQITDQAMDDLIASLRTMPDGQEGSLYVIDWSNDKYPEGNKVTIKQMNAAKEKGWIMYAWDESIGKWGDWTTYEDLVTGITGHQANTTQRTRDAYDLQGRRQNSTQKGLNIVRLPDGSVHKVVVK